MSTLQQSPDHEEGVPADPLIDEVRAIRRAISEQFGNDVDRLCDHLQELERQHPERLVEPAAPPAGQTAPGQR
jgi:hypothetical protein